MSSCFVELLLSGYLSHGQLKGKSIIKQLMLSRRASTIYQPLNSQDSIYPKLCWSSLLNLHYGCIEVFKKNWVSLRPLLYLEKCLLSTFMKLILFFLDLILKVLKRSMYVFLQVLFSDISAYEVNSLISCSSSCYFLFCDRKRCFQPIQRISLNVFTYHIEFHLSESMLILPLVDCVNA